MTREALKQILKDKLNAYDKDMLVDFIADVCLMYVNASALTDMSTTNCIQQCINDIQTNIQKVNNFSTQTVNANLYDTRK